MSVIDNAVNWAIDIANDKTHGYDQTNRWGPDYDCSSFVISAWDAAGVDVKGKTQPLRLCRPGLLLPESPQGISRRSVPWTSLGSPDIPKAGTGNPYISSHRL